MRQLILTDDSRVAAEPGVRYHCDVCGADITLTVRIRCAGGCEDFDLCGTCFCTGSEIGQHKAWHDYRVIEQHATPVFCPDWGVDEELLLIDGCQLYGVGNWMDIADHVGNRTKEEVEKHFVDVYIKGKNGLPSGDKRAEKAVADWRESHPPDPSFHGEERLPIVGPDVNFTTDVTMDEFQRARRERIETLRASQLPIVPPKGGKPLVSAPKTHSELSGFMPGRLEFEQEFEQDAEHAVKDMEFGLVYSFGGDTLPTESEALNGKTATQGKPRMESSGRGGPVHVSTKVQDEPEEETFADALDSQAEPMSIDGKNEEPLPAANQSQSQSQMQHVRDSSHTAAEPVKLEDETGADTKAAAPAPQAEPASKSDEMHEDASPDWEEDPMDLELKLAILDIYSEQLNRRSRKKQFLFERNLVDYRRNTAAERRRPKEERDLLARIKHFATLQTATDFEELYQDLCYEEALKKTVRQLQHYRSLGITTLAEAARYDREHAERTKRQLEAAEGTLPSQAGRARHRERSQSVLDKKDTDEFSFATAPSIQLLTREEQQLCSLLHILPQPFLILKTVLLTYCFAHHRDLTIRHCERLCSIDPRKLAYIYDFFREKGYFHAVAQARTWEESQAPNASMTTPSHAVHEAVKP